MSKLRSPDHLPPELLPVADELHRIHEAVTFSAQGQFEQMKLWRTLNMVLGLPAAILAAISGGTGLAAQELTRTPAVLALLAAGFGAALTTLNPSRRVSQSQASANAYLELQTASRQLLTIQLTTMSLDDAMTELKSLSARRDEVNRTADPPGWYAYWRSRRNLEEGGQSYDVDGGA